MRKLLIIGIIAISSSLTFAQTNTLKTDTINPKIEQIQKAEIQPRDVSEKIDKQEKNKKTNPQETNKVNSNATINRRKK